MSPASESRYLPPFLAIAASLVLVCGGLLLLTSTMPWSARPDSGGGTPPEAIADAPAETPVSATIAFATLSNDGSVSARAEMDEAEGEEAAETAAVQLPEGEEARAEPARTVQSDHPSGSEDDAAASADPHSDEAAAATAEAGAVAQAVAPDVAQINETEADAADVAQIDEIEADAAEAVTAESMSVNEAEPTKQDMIEPSPGLETPEVQTALDEIPPAAASPTAQDQTGTLLAETPPVAIASETIAEHDSESAPASPEATHAQKAEAHGAAPAQATDERARAGDSQETRAEVAAAVPLPALPKRKPAIQQAVLAQTARDAARREPASRPEAPKQTETRPVAAQQTPAQSGAAPSRWLPMALAPADKPIAKEPARLSGAAYSSKVWAALARSKPRAGQSGSATVSFTIGWGGSLSGVSVAKSSGNARIDQLALATVRGAAFPAPASGPASFTIRIDFH